LKSEGLATVPARTDFCSLTSSVSVSSETIADHLNPPDPPAPPAAAVGVPSAAAFATAGPAAAEADAKSGRGPARVASASS
jgi:hypothetical protein